MTLNQVADDAAMAAEIEQLRAQVARHQSSEAMARAQMGAVTRTLELLTSQPDLDTFLNQMLGVMAEHLGVRYVAFWLHDADADALHFDRVYRRGDGEGSGQVQTGAAIGHASALRPVAARELPVWAEMNRTRAPVVVADVSTDPRMELYRAEVLKRGIETVLHVPFLLPGGAIGYLGAATKTREYCEEELAVTQAMAHQITVAIQLARLAGRERAAAENAAVLGERNRIARDIHDTLAQSLTAVLLQAQAASGALDRAAPEPQTAQHHLGRVSALTGDALEEARRAVLALRPMRLDAVAGAGTGVGDAATGNVSLSGALARLCDERAAQGPMRVVFLQEGAPRPLPAPLEEGLLRVAQESLSNVAKHAEADCAWVELAFEADAVTLRVQDNGLGFDPAALRAFESRAQPERADGGGFGLPGLRERAEALDGALTLSSRAGQGAEVRVCVPFEGELH